MVPRIPIALSALALTPLVTAAAAPEPAARTFTVPLDGRAETNIVHPSGGTGDPDGTGVVRLTVDPDSKLVCYDFNLSGVATPMMAHIHRGSELNNGPTVVTLFTGLGGELEGCVPWIRNRLAEIVSDPSNFYVNVYTTEYPDGAVRGQLGG